MRTRSVATDERGPPAHPRPLLALVSGNALRAEVMAAARHLLPPPVGDRVTFHETHVFDPGAFQGLDPEIAILDLTAGGFTTEQALLLQCWHRRTVFVALVPATPDGGESAVKLRAAHIGVCSIDTRPSARRPTDLADALERAIAGHVARLVLDGWQRSLAPPLYSFLEGLWTRCWRPLTVVEASKLLHRDPSTVRRFLARAGLPSLFRLIVWGRLFHASWLLRDHGRPVVQIAAILDYPSEGALAVQMKRHVGETPNVVRREGLQLVVEAFARRCERESAP